MAWAGVVIAESLADPRLLNRLPVYKTWVSEDGLPVDGAGRTGRWHLYWVTASDADVDAIQQGLVRDMAWYAHFWRDDRITVLFADARFEMRRSDRTTWEPAIAHGLARGIPIEQLDFPTDDSVGTLT
jgi:hypothetical protein